MTADLIGIMLSFEAYFALGRVDRLSCTITRFVLSVCHNSKNRTELTQEHYI